MGIIYALVPLSLILFVLSIYGLFTAFKNGQSDYPEGLEYKKVVVEKPKPPHRNNYRH